MDFKDMMQPHLKNVRPYVPGKPIEQLRREGAFEGDIIKLASNENPYPPIDEIKLAIIDEIDSLNRYPSSGSYYLCRELARFLNVDEKQIFVGNGSNEIIELLVKAFIKPNEEVIIPHPSFIAYGLVIEQAGIRGIRVPLKEYRLDLNAMKEHVTQNTKMVFICNPNNPTGTHVSGNEVDLFMNSLREDILVIFDEAYFEYVIAEDFPNTIEILKRRPNIVILRTFSKIHSLSGLRIGYSISHEDVVTCLHMVRQPFNVNRIAQIAAQTALKHIDRLEGRKRENREQMKFVEEELRKLGFTVPPSQTNFILAIAPERYGDIVGKLEQRGIIVRGMKRFGLGEESFRVTIGTKEENTRLIREIKALQ